MNKPEQPIIPTPKEDEKPLVAKPLSKASRRHVTNKTLGSGLAAIAMIGVFLAVAVTVAVFVYAIEIMLR